MIDLIVESCVDILKTVPILLIVYALLYVIEMRMHSTPKLLEKAQQLGPFFGALAGAVPQCGFSAAAAALYNSGWLAPATLVAVFVSTSDEAIPLLLANPGAGKYIALLIGCKIALAVAGGYLLQWTLFRQEKNRREKIEIELDGCSCCGSSALGAIAGRTLKTTVFLLVTMCVINIAVYFIGEDALSSVLLTGSLWQPALCALIGLIPGCAVSVLLTELFLNGTISFGAVIAGLSTGAGFGFMLLFQKHGGRKNALRIVGATYLVAVAGGMLCTLAGL